MIIVYTYLVTHHDDPAVIGKVFQTLIIEIILNNMVAIVVQMYMALLTWPVDLILIFYLQVLHSQDLQT